MKQEETWLNVLLKKTKESVQGGPAALRHSGESKESSATGIGISSDGRIAPWL
jgi:hypothetical protein